MLLAWNIKAKGGRTDNRGKYFFLCNGCFSFFFLFFPLKQKGTDNAKIVIGERGAGGRERGESWEAF